MYFEQMLCLILPKTEDRVTSSSYSPTTGSNAEGDIDERKEGEEASSRSAPEICVESNSAKVNYKQQLLDILKEKTEHTNEEKTFLLSLVPAFKKLKTKSTGKNGNVECYEESKKYGVSATV
jgi:hypothetical protein